MAKKPSISVLMTTYNRCQGLSNVVQNILEQDFQTFEIVIVNDGSIDDTKNILRALQDKYPIKVINNSINLGLQKSLNVGLGHCSGKYIARIDDHDFWIDSSKLSKQFNFLEKNSDYAVVGTSYRFKEKEVRNPLSDADIRKQILFRSPFCHVSVLIRKSILDEMGGYDESLPYSEDWDLWLKIGRKARMKNLNECMTYVHYDKNETSLSNDYFLKQIKLNQKLIQKYTSDYPKRKRALAYHRMVLIFFTIFPIDSLAHKVAHQIFEKAFFNKR